MSLPENEDVRLNHILISAQQVLDFDISVWSTMMKKEENQNIIKDFLDNSTTILLLTYLGINEELMLSLEMMKIGTPLPKRLCFFLKHNKTITTENYKQDIVFGNLYNFPLNQYQDMFAKVIMPIFCNPLNHKRWPAEISQDIIDHVQDFQTCLSYHVSIAEQKTVLMIPETAKLIDNVNVDALSDKDCSNFELRNILNAITEMLSDWIPILKEILDLTTEHIFSQVDQGPITEISFWTERKANLEFIYGQIDSPLVKKMVLALEKTENPNFPLFKMLLQDIVEGLDEAREVCENITKMSADLEEIDKCSYHKLKDFIPNALPRITSSWVHSKYYRSVPSRIIILLKKICYILYEKTHKFLDPLSLFAGKRDEAKENVKLSLYIMEQFLKSYNWCREKFKSSDKNPNMYPWVFPDERVFTQFKIFIQRLEEILEIFLIAEAYSNIPSQQLCKIQHVQHKRRIEDIQATFTKAFKTFENCKYDPLDLETTEFSRDYMEFSELIQKLDTKFGIIIGQVCLNCSPPEDAYEVMDIFENMLKRSLVHQKFKKFIPSPITNTNIDLDNVEETSDKLLRYVDTTDERFVYKNLPIISGALQWSHDLQKKLMLPMESSENNSKYFDTKEDYNSVTEKRKEIKQLLEKFEEQLFSKWKIILDNGCSKLDQDIFINNKSHISLNFDSQISEVAQETYHLKELRKDTFLTDKGKKFNEVSKDLLLSHSLLACSVRWYNDLTENLFDIEKKLIYNDWNKITDLILKGYSKKWTSEGLLAYSQELYAVTKTVYENINQAKKNIQVIEESIKSWSSTPMFTREQPNSLVDYEVPKETKVQEQISVVKNTNEEMKDVLERNRQLFKIDAKSDEWKSYTSYLERVMENGLKNAIKCSLKYIEQNVDSTNTKLPPFYEVSMWMNQGMCFTPPLKSDEPKNLSELFETVIDKIYFPAGAVKRMTNTESNYYDGVCKYPDLEALKASIRKSVSSGCTKALSGSEVFNLYSDLWIQNIDDDLADFVLHGPMQDTPSKDAEKSVEEIPSVTPTEEDFKAHLAQFDKLHRKIDDIPNIFKVESWLLLNVTSFKSSLLSIVKKWSSAYKNKLVELKSLGKLRKLEDEDD